MTTQTDDIELLAVRAELAALIADVAEYQSNLTSETNARCKAEEELAALRAMIAAAPVVAVTFTEEWYDSTPGCNSMSTTQRARFIKQDLPDGTPLYTNIDALLPAGLRGAT